MAGLYHLRKYRTSDDPGGVIVRLEPWYDATCGALRGEWVNLHPHNPLMGNVYTLRSSNSDLLPCELVVCPTTTIIEDPETPEEPEPPEPPESEPGDDPPGCQCCLFPEVELGVGFFGETAGSSDAEVALTAAFESLIAEFPFGWCDDGETSPLVDAQYTHGEPSDPPYDAFVRLAFNPALQGTRVIQVSYRVINPDTNTVIDVGQALYSVPNELSGCEDSGPLTLTLYHGWSYGELWEWAETITLERFCDGD